MTTSLVVLAVLMVTIVVWLVRQTINTQPWVADAPGAPLPEAERVFEGSPKFGLVAFLAVVLSFFALFVSAYAMRMTLDDWTPLNEPRLLIVNTVVLFFSSVALQLAYTASKRGDEAKVRIGLFAGALLAAFFLVGQFIAWRELIAAGLYLQSNASYAFFYLLTGIHAVHLLGGLWVIGRATVTVFRGDYDPAAVRQTAELCAIYWHTLLFIWLGLYWLLLAT